MAERVGFESKQKRKFKDLADTGGTVDD
jgi:hypothetical protein